MQHGVCQKCFLFSLNYTLHWFVLFSVKDIYISIVRERFFLENFSKNDFETLFQK